VRTWIPERAFGFIHGDSGERDIFFHQADYAASIPPEVGLRVSFKLVQKTQGLRALDVGDIDEASYDD
jgi:cold shock CspA family protein